MQFTAPLPAFAAALRTGKPVRIVALGSSSTMGIGASSPQASYPARLQAELSRIFPGRSITVENLGVGGQLAADMLTRIRTEVLPLRPTLVIWQTGVNDALRHVGLAAFKETMLLGIDELHGAGVDVVLLGVQYFPRAERLRDFAHYRVAMRRIAEARNVPILRRYELMQHLVASAQFTTQQLLASDLFHMSDVTYGCLGRILAEALRGEAARAGAVKYPPDRARQAGAAPTVPAVPASATTTTVPQ